MSNAHSRIALAPLALLLAGAVLIGCPAEDATPPAATGPGEPSDNAGPVVGPGDGNGGDAGDADDPSGAPLVSDEPYAGPACTVSIEVMESFPEQYAATVAIHAPTGGHALRLDHASLEEGVLRLYATLEKPGRDEVVTQAFEWHTVRHPTGTDRIVRAEAWVRSHQRGTPADPVAHRLAARAE